MSAEAIAKVVADLKAGRIRKTAGDDWLINVKRMVEWINTATELIPIVDATDIYHQIVDVPRAIDVYEDHMLRPVWVDALICYVNNHGNVHVGHCFVFEREEFPDWWIENWGERLENEHGHTLDWDRVRWVHMVTLYVGGRSSEGPVATGGPVHAWTIAVYEEGEIADIRWYHLMPDLNSEMWDNSLLVVLQTINFMNCVNVELAEPVRSRAEQRRLARALPTTRISEIRVRPVSRSGGSRQVSGTVGMVPLHLVRGHFARYGPEYGRGLLFGKYSGRFWHQPHARGNVERGVTQQRFEIETE